MQIGGEFVSNKHAKCKAPDGPLSLCGAHKTEGMRRADSWYCRACKERCASHGVPTYDLSPVKRLLCAECARHRGEDLVYQCHCRNVGGRLELAFGVGGGGSLTVRGAICPTHATFGRTTGGRKERRESLRCKHHVREVGEGEEGAGLVDLQNPVCTAEGCSERATYGIEGKNLLCCEEHAKNGMQHYKAVWRAKKRNSNSTAGS